MNHREHYEMLAKHGVSVPDYTEVISTLVNRLLESLYIPHEVLRFKGDPERCKKFDIDDSEPINWGDLSVSEVKEYKDGSFQVIIEEAAPQHCPTLCAYIEKYMKAWGWTVNVETEW